MTVRSVGGTRPSGVGRTQPPKGFPDFTDAQVTVIRQSMVAVRVYPWPREWLPYRIATVLAMMVNGWHESRLTPTAANTAGEDSHGVWQLNRAGGVGTGHAVENLQDVPYAAKLMLDEQVMRGRIASAKAVWDPRMTLQGFTAWWGEHVERPGSDRDPITKEVVKGRQAVGIARGRTLRLWMPAVAALPARLDF